MYGDEVNCLKALEAIRWGKHPSCPDCGDKKCYRLKGGKLLKCAKCYRIYSAKVGTIFEDSPLPLVKWFWAIYIFSNHKKGISSHQLAKDLGVTQKTAWFMLGRIRYAMKVLSFDKPLEGIVEADETYIGGRTRRKGDPPRKHGRGSENLTPVFGLVERGGNVIAKPVKRVNGATLQGEINARVKAGSTIMTDEFSSYNGLSKNFTHETVNHSAQEYARGFAHVNNAENFWSMLKRGIVGIYHHVSDEHLHRYCDEFVYRQNTRRTTDAERFGKTLGQMNGRRLTYKQLTTH